MVRESATATSPTVGGSSSSIRQSQDAVADGSQLDLDGTLQRLGGDRELLACLAKVFAEDSPALLERLLNAVGAMRGDEIRNAAHALRGLAANFGAPSLTRSLRQLEEIGVRNDLVRARELLNEICTQTAQLQESLDRHR